MKSRLTQIFSSIIIVSCVFALMAAVQSAAQADQSSQAAPASSIVTKSATAIGFQVGSGSTKVDLKGTEAMPGAKGEAKVEIKSNAGASSIEIETEDLKSPTTIGSEFLTYVLWVVTPEGRTSNAGELFINKDGKGKLSATSPAQTFALIVTAEPYFAVRVPSEIVVLQSEARKNTKGKVYPASQYKLMRRSQYEKLGNPLALTLDPNVPLEMYEARNAVEIAKSRGADKDAADTFAKAQASLQAAEDALARKDKKAAISAARQTAQFADDARSIAVMNQEQARIEKERQDAAAAAKAQAEAKAAEEAAAAKEKADAELAAQRQAAADQAAQAARERQQLRSRLLDQFNRVLPTTDTPRGLVVNMGDVLFDTGKSNLRVPAREALAKLSGIVLNYPSLHLNIEGHTDSTGGAVFNQTLSEQRADSVKDYLVSQGLNESSLTAEGLGMENPVADNNTADGRQKNRRVEIVVSGEVIGTLIGSNR